MPHKVTKSVLSRHPWRVYHEGQVRYLFSNEALALDTTYQVALGVCPASYFKVASQRDGIERDDQGRTYGEFVLDYTRDLTLPTGWVCRKDSSL